MMKPVLQAMAEGVDPVLLQFAADLLAERAVERRNVEVISGPFIGFGNAWYSAGAIRRIYPDRMFIAGEMGSAC